MSSPGIVAGLRSSTPTVSGLECKNDSSRKIVRFEAILRRQLAIVPSECKPALGLY